MDSAIHLIYLYPVDNATSFVNAYVLVSPCFRGITLYIHYMLHYTFFEQSSPELYGQTIS